MLNPITDHAARAVSRLLFQFKTAGDPQALLTILAAEAQAIEDAFTQMISLMNPAIQTGDLLNRIAHMVGLNSKASGSDGSFRVLINTQIAINKSQGTNADVLAAARAIALSHHMTPAELVINESGAGDTGDFQPAGGFELRLGNPVDGVTPSHTNPRSDAVAVWRAAKAAAGAGIRVLVEYRPTGLESSGSAFRFGGGSPAEAAAGFGVGKLMGVVSHE
jgi:hypothetical protein